MAKNSQKKNSGEAIGIRKPSPLLTERLPKNEADEKTQSAGLIRRTMKHYKSGPEVEGLIDEILKTDKDTFDTLLMLGIKEGERDGSDLAEAEALIRQALKINRTSAKAFNNLGVILMRRGKLDDAAESYSKAMDLKPEESLTYRNYVICRKFARGGDQALEDRLVSLLAGAKTDEDRIDFHYALGKIYDDCGRYDDSFRNYLLGNRLERGRFEYQWMDTSSLVDRLIEAFPVGYHRTKPWAGADSELPLFVLGMPRSGTTLIEQIISSHPLVFGAGELNGLEEIVRRLKSHLNVAYPEDRSSFGVEDWKNSADYYLKFLRGFSDDARRITDKMPHNFLHLGLISLLFRNPRVIHCRRDPLDTCLSIFFQRFSFKGHPYSYDLEELGRYYYDYERLMAHWREVLPPGMMLEVQYEEVLERPEEMSRKLIDFCGLEWDDRCLRFYENDRKVRTSSAWQVRQPLYKTSKERWRHYEKHLAPLQRVLDGRVG
jgi:tetratricopeptide (TPR) repeat protein